MESNYNIGTKPAKGDVYVSGIAYIILPSGVSRDIYIAECFRSSTVSIYSEHNGYTNRVPIDIFSLNFIVFPDEVNKFGSAVGFNVDPITKRFFINSIFNKEDDVSGLQENQFKFKRELKGKFVEIVGSPDGSYLGLNIKTDKGGKLNLKIGSDDNSGELNITIDGDINLNALGNTTIKQYNKLTVQTVNSKDEEDSASFVQEKDSNEFFDKEHTINAAESFNVNTPKVSINSGDEPFVLGKKFKDFMDDFIDEVSKSTVTTDMGDMPLVNASLIAEYKKKTQELLSTIAFIDK